MRLIYLDKAIMKATKATCPMILKKTALPTRKVMELVAKLAKMVKMTKTARILAKMIIPARVTGMTG